MSTLRAQVKGNARVILKKNWFKAIVIFCIILLLAIAISALEVAYRKAFGLPDSTSFEAGLSTNTIIVSIIVSLVFTLITFILTTPLILGQTEWYWKLTSGKPGSIEGVFVWFGSFKLFMKSLWLRINITLRMLPWLLLTIALPYAIIIGSSYVASQNPYNDAVAMASLGVMMLGGLLFMGGLVLYCLIFTRFFLASYLLVEDSTRKVNGCVKDSVRLTRGHRGEIFGLWFSFIGWFALCIIFFPAFFVIPYFWASNAVYAKYLIFKDRVREADDNSDTIEFKQTRQFPPQQ